MVREMSSYLKLIVDKEVLKEVFLIISPINQHNTSVSCYLPLKCVIALKKYSLSLL